MSAREAPAWWAEVEDVRARIEARREGDDLQPPRLRALDGGRTVRPAAMGHQHLSAVPQRPGRRTVQLTRRPAPAPRRRALVDAPPQVRPVSTPVPRRAPRTVNANPDRIALWAVMLGLVLLLVCVGSAGAATSLGERTLKAPMNGRDVRQLQSALKHLGLLDANATAHFGPLTRRAVKRFQRSRCITADGIAGPVTIRAIVDHAPRCAGASRTRGRAVRRGLAHGRVVTWYGPGWYGRRTACGNTLTPRLMGVAHRTLPCGTRVTFSYGDRVVEATVVDRGPYAHGVDFDLTWGAARALGVLAAGRASVRASH